jgi:hypothetical protein
MNISVATAPDIKMDDEPIESPDKAPSSESDNTTPVVDCHVTSSAPNLPDPSKFPLLYSLDVCITKHMNHLVQEIAKFHGDTSISFTRRNNRTGTLISLPSNQTLDRYSFDFSKPKSVLDEMVKCIVKNTNSTEEEVVSCLLMVLISKYEDSFVSI